MSGDNSVDGRLIGKGASVGYASGKSEDITGALGAAQYSFTKGEVIEYISNPSNFLSREVVSTGETLGEYLNRDDTQKIYRNQGMVNFMPPNSIIVYPQDGSRLPVIAYPYFPPHIVLPLKPGEQVWLIVETKGNINFYYWQCRVHGDRQVDDLNYTNLDNNSEVRLLRKKFIVEGKVDDKNFLVPAAATLKSSGIIPSQQNLGSILSDSVAWMEEHVGEPVPRTFGKCSDFLMQGSNNTTIQMTTEKFRVEDDISSETFLNSDGKRTANYTHTPLAGAIDVFVGKEKQRLGELSVQKKPEDNSSPGSFNARLVSNEQGSQGMEFYTLDKLDEYAQGEENQNEGLDNPRNVFARMYLGMNAALDESFQFANSDFEDAHAVGPSAAMYADHCRIFAESSIRAHNFFGNSLLDMSQDGTITIQSGEGDEAAKIILRPSGDIVIKPGSKGILYLGGDESESAGVAVSVSTLVGPPPPGSTFPQVPGITTSMGGTSFLGDPVSGLVSSKVMIKV